MAKTRKEKEKIVEELTLKLNKIKSAVFTCYQGISVNEIQKLRKNLEEKDGEYKVIKNRLIKLALKKSNLKNINLPEFKKPIALVFGYKDEIVPAKILDNFLKEHPTLEIICGILDGKLISKKEIEEIAKIPSRDELLARIVYVVQAPKFGLVNALRGNLKNLVGVLKSISQRQPKLIINN